MYFRLGHILAGSLAIFGASASAVLDLTPDNFDEIVLKSGKPSLVEFFAPWCGHCKNLAPVYDELAGVFESSKSKVNIAKVDADAHKELGRRFGVQGFPTLKWFDGKSDKPSDYNSGRDLESLSGFITDKTGLKSKKKAVAPSAVETWNDGTFKAEIGGDKAVLLEIFAPWCGHCKSLAPIYENLATTFAGEPEVVIAKMDAESPTSKATAKELGVKSYPTIKFFPKGSKEPVAYEGGRTEQAFVDYINEQTGTHRTPGGGLDATAGTIAALDSIVAKFTGGEALATVAKEITKATTGVQDKYAEYYVKVFSKLSENSEYVEKESKRLKSLLSKGGLAPEKIDDLTKRSNILNSFAVKAGIKEEL
ncbi:hypothetical protein AAFC00_003273 [Neodothiora populina]|uniref:protein disulfide-isomerase n=1 Tax=Neodothiora populina TaxID=2781224 RepID=A0ABR3P9V6_9PEZI